MAGYEHDDWVPYGSFSGDRTEKYYFEDDEGKAWVTNNASSIPSRYKSKTKIKGEGPGWVPMSDAQKMEFNSIGNGDDAEKAWKNSQLKPEVKKENSTTSNQKKAVKSEPTVLTFVKDFLPGIKGVSLNELNNLNPGELADLKTRADKWIKDNKYEVGSKTKEYLSKIDSLSDSEFLNAYKNLSDSEKANYPTASAFYSDWKALKDEEKGAEIDALIEEQGTSLNKEEQKAEAKRKKAEEKILNKEKSIKEKKEKIKTSNLEREIATEEFWKKNPSLLKYIFGKSGAKAGERLQGLAELAASLGADFLKGAVKPGDTDPVVGRIQKLVNYARDKEAERMQTVFSAETEIDAETKKRMRELKQNPRFSEMNNDDLYSLAKDMQLPEMSKEEFLTRYKLTGNENADAYYEEYLREHDTSISGMQTQSQAEDLRQKRTDNRNKNFESFVEKVKSVDELNRLVQSLQENKKVLRQGLIDLDTNMEKNFWDVANLTLNFTRGLETATSSASNASTDSRASNESQSSSSGGHVDVSVKGGPPVPVVQASVSAGGQWSKEKSFGKTDSKTSQVQLSDTSAKDIRTISRIPLAEKEGKAYLERNKETVAAIKANIEEQIKWIDSRIAELQTRISQVNEKVNDGIIRSTGKRQWLVREDGSKIELNPNDNVYATLNELTTKKDSGESVVHMDKDDRAVVYRQRLGHGDGVKTKDFNYYRQLLGRG